MPKATIIPTDHVLKCDIVPKGSTLQFQLRMSHLRDFPPLTFAGVSLGLLADSENARAAVEALCRAAAIDCSKQTAAACSDALVEGLTIDWSDLEELHAEEREADKALLALLGAVFGEPKMGTKQ